MSLRTVAKASSDRFKQLFGIIDLTEKYQSTFHGLDGEAVLRHIMKVGHLTESTYVPGDPTATAFREGQRHLALSILKAVKKDTTELIKQVEENLEQP